MGTLERDVLAVLWRAGRPLVVREVLDELNRDRSVPLAYTTAMTVLSRMTRKGALERQPVRRGYQYVPVAPDEAALAVRRVIDDHGLAAVAHFLAQAEVDEDMRARLRRIVDGAAGVDDADGSPA